MDANTVNCCAKRTFKEVAEGKPPKEVLASKCCPVCKERSIKDSEKACEVCEELAMNCSCWTPEFCQDKSYHDRAYYAKKRVEWKAKLAALGIETD